MPDNTNPFTTGAVARLLSSTEPRVAETVRRGRITPEPTIVAGRRLWTYEQVLKVAEILGVLDDVMRQRIDVAFRAPLKSKPIASAGDGAGS